MSRPWQIRFFWNSKGPTGNAPRTLRRMALLLLVAAGTQFGGQAHAEIGGYEYTFNPYVLFCYSDGCDRTESWTKPSSIYVTKDYRLLTAVRLSTTYKQGLIVANGKTACKTISGDRYCASFRKLNDNEFEVRNSDARYSSVVVIRNNGGKCTIRSFSSRNVSAAGTPITEKLISGNNCKAGARKNIGN